MDRPAGKACLSDYVSDGDVTEVLCALFPRTVGTMCAAASIWHPILFFSHALAGNTTATCKSWVGFPIYAATSAFKMVQPM